MGAKTKAKTDVTSKDGKDVGKLVTDAETTKAPGATAAESNKPQRPNEEEFAKRINDIKTQIDAKKEKMKGLSEQIEKRSTGKEEFEGKQQELYGQLDSIKSERTEYIGQVRELQDVARNMQKQERENRRDLKQMEGSMKQVTEDGIDKEIQALEYKMSTTTMSLKEEKECMKKIKLLKAQRPVVQKNVKEYEQMKAKIEIAEAVSNPVASHELIKQLEAKIQEKKTNQDELYAQVQQLKTQREQSTSGVKELIEKKRAFKAEVDELIKQRTHISDEKKAMQKTFNEWEKKQRVEKQKKLDAQWAAETAIWAAEQAQRELEKPNPYVGETTLLEQTIAYCKGLLMKDEAAPEAEAKAIDHNNPEGAKILVSKKDRDTEPWFAATKKKALRKKGSEKKATAIKHTADTFAIFSQLKMPPPMSTGDLEPALETLNESLAKVNEKVRVWENDRKEKLEAAKAKQAESKEAVATTAA